jgi:menaquinone-dependent protoporphyrinogen oxidase
MHQKRFTMRVLIVFSTTEGHTRKLAQFAAARLTSLGHQVQVHDAAEPNAPDPVGFDCALLVASVHVSRYQRSLIEFASKHCAVLNRIPNAFISVSLSAAGDNPCDLAGLRNCVERLELETHWHPGVVHHAAGAMLFRAYGIFTKLVIKFIAQRRGNVVNTSEDYDLTNYIALEMFIDDFAANAILSAGKATETVS